METLTQIYNSLALWQFILIGAAVLMIWFLPAILALFFNPKHAKYILVACVPAGFSIIAWGGVMVWAVTGKVFDRFKDKVKEPEPEQKAF